MEKNGEKPNYKFVQECSDKVHKVIREIKKESNLLGPSSLLGISKKISDDFDYLLEQMPRQKIALEDDSRPKSEQEANTPPRPKRS